MLTGCKGAGFQNYFRITKTTRIKKPRITFHDDDDDGGGGDDNDENKDYSTSTVFSLHPHQLPIF
jgi:hypothetical protein